MAREESKVIVASDIDEAIGKAIARYNPADAAIAKMSDEFMPLTVDGLDDRDGMKRVHAARMTVRNSRTAIESMRKELKADSLSFGRRVDSEAKRLTSMIEPIEDHLKFEEGKIQAEKDRLAKEEEDRKLAALQGRMDSLAAVGSTLLPHIVKEMSAKEFEEALAHATDVADLKRIREERLAAEQKAESDRLAKERAELEERQAEQAKAEAAAAAKRKAEEDRIAAERRKLEAEQAKVAEAKRRQEEAGRIKAAEEAAAAKAKEDARLDEIRRKEAAEAKAKAEAVEAARIEACRPVVERIEAFADTVEALMIPDVPCSSAIRGALHLAASRIRKAAKEWQAESQ